MSDWLTWIFTVAGVVVGWGLWELTKELSFRREMKKKKP